MQPSAAWLSEGLAMAGLDVLTTGVWLLARLCGTRCWPALSLQRRAPEPPVWTAGASNWPSLAPRPCGTSLLSPAKELVNGRATIRAFASHKRRKAVAEDQKDAPSSAFRRQDTPSTQQPKRFLERQNAVRRVHTTPYRQRVIPPSCVAPPPRRRRSRHHRARCTACPPED